MSRHGLVKKNILIVLSNFADSAERRFFLALKQYLDERKQNRVYFYFLTPQKKLAVDCVAGSVADLPTFIRRQKIEVAALATAVKPAELKKIRRNVTVLTGINQPVRPEFDFTLTVDNHSLKTIATTAQRLSVVDRLNWDTDFFGVNIARLNHRRLTASLVRLALTICRRNKIKCLYYTADSTDPTSVQLAEANGFHFANIRVTYQLTLTMAPSIKKSRYAFRLGTPADLSTLIHISKGLYRDSRYYFDTHFSEAICDKFYATWIKKIATSKKKTDRVYVVTDGRKPIGYLAAGVEFDTVYIFLVGVDSAYQGQGVGKILMSGFMADMYRKGFSKFEVVTQGRNIASQRLYQSYGFKITASEIDYHKWF